MKKILFTLLFFISIFSLNGLEKWWQKTIFYEIFPRSFQDSNGDGNGDFNGIKSRLDYLKDLGINGIWLNPIFDSPSYHGYDCEDYYKIDKDFGAIQELKELLNECNKRDIKVIADLAINHVSIKHNWFQKSIKKIVPYTDYFIWEKKIPKGKWGKPWADEKIVDSGYNKPESVWFYNDERKEYYYAAFDANMPDLNLKNKIVQEEVKKIIKFWLDKGFSGFRLDAVRYLIEEGPYKGQRDTETTINFLKELSKYARSIKQNIFLVGEVSASIDIISKYYDNGEGLDACFDFNLGEEIIKSFQSNKIKQQTGNVNKQNLNSKLPENIYNNLIEKKESKAPLEFYSPFLTNHDQNRIMYQLNNDLNKMKIAAIISLTEEGTPFIYYGEEIGITQDQTDDDQFNRGLMQWDESNYAGFTKDKTIWLDDPKWFPRRKDQKAWWLDYWNSINKKESSVSGEINNPDSLFNIYKNLIAIKKNNQEFQSPENDSIRFIKHDNNVLAYFRISGNSEESLVVINSSENEDRIFDLKEIKFEVKKVLLKNINVVIKNNKIYLKPLTYIILKGE